MSSLPLIVIWVLVDGGVGQLLRIRWPLHLLRGALSILMLGAFAFALLRLPLAEAYSIFFIAPLLVTALAVPMLGEHVDGKRWVAIGVGLGGVLVVLRPTGSGVLTLGGLAVLLAAVGYAASAILVRIVGRTDTTQSMVFWMLTMVSIGAGAIALPDWVAVRREDWLVLVGLAFSGALGQYTVTEAFRRAPASVIAPLEYTALAWGVGLDWVLWNTLPDRWMLLGAGIIIASGLFLLRRERVHLEAEHP
jgi:drug/metabolite transporter (DMT)-like permease